MDNELKLIISVGLLAIVILFLLLVMHSHTTNDHIHMQESDEKVSHEIIGEPIYPIVQK